VAARIVVLVSGTGTLLQALLDASSAGAFPADPVLVVSDTPDAAALERAGRAGVETRVVRPGDHPDRAAWDAQLTEVVAAARPDWVVCAGFMRLLGPAFLARFDGRIVNSHPALLPSFPGAHGVRDALAYGVRVTGCTVHLVDAGVDTGPVLAQRAVDVGDDDDEESLHERIKVVERELLVDVVARLVVHGCTVSGRKVTIP
jgi:phosphoribosylglycinamide formyltransferase-1